MELPLEIKEAVVYSAQRWPRTLTSDALVQELNALARRVYVLAITEAHDQQRLDRETQAAATVPAQTTER